MFCLPVVAKADYADLTAVIEHGLPETFEGWLCLSEHWVAQYGAKGVLLVDVDPPVLAKFMAQSPGRNDVDSLLAFAALDQWRDPD